MAGEFTIWGPRDTVVDTSQGYSFYLNRPTFEESFAEVNRGYHRRSEILKSDHVSPTYFSREVVRTVSDSPFVTYEEWRPFPNEGVYEYKTRTRHISPRIADPAFWYPPDDWYPRLGNAEDRSITIARDRLRQRDSMSLGTAIAEAKSTATMLAVAGGDMAKKLIGFQNYVRSLRRNRDKVLATAGAYLQGTYGWGSLAQDVFSIDQRLRSDLDQDLLIKSSCTTRISESYSGGSWNARSNWEGLVKVGYTAKIEDAFARNLEGWGLINPISIAWEVVPLSFCVDWLVPVGNTLASLTATAGLEFRGGYVSTVTKGNTYRSYEPLPWEQLIAAGNHHVAVKRFDRRVLVGFEPPRLYANENPFSTTRILSGLALITQAVLGRYNP